MLQIKNYSLEYVEGKRVINNLNLSVREGDIYAFVGRNGVGKTTTIKSIVGINHITEGDIQLDKISILKDPLKYKSMITYVPDNPILYEYLTGEQYLNFIADIYELTYKEREERIKEYAEKFELFNELGNLINSYSHGMKQKLLIISVLLHNPKNWILDEPMTGLDPKASYTLKKLMKEHSRKGNTVFFSTHVLEVAEKICDKIAVIDKGKIIFVGTCEELKEKSKTNSSLEESFLKIIEG